MDTWAIIPVKSLHASKKRLAHILTAAERADLIHHFLQHTLSILEQTTAVQQTLVISSDPRVLNLAWQYRAWTLAETVPAEDLLDGLNVAVSQATTWAAAQGAASILILPVDLPLMQVNDVERMVTAVQHAQPNGWTQPASMAICTDKVGQGTNALCISPPGNFTFHYGPGSFQKHIAEAARHNMSVQIVAAPNLQFDLDTESDWHIYQSLVNQPISVV